MESQPLLEAAPVASSLAAPHVLVCDYGSLWTKGALLGRVDGVMRRVATCAVPTPVADDGLADIRSATDALAGKLRSLTGAPDFSGSESDERSPQVELFPAGSAAPALNVVIVVPTPALATRVEGMLQGATYTGWVRSGTVTDLLVGDLGALDAHPDLVVLVEGRAGYIPAGELQLLAQLLARTGADTRLVPVLHCYPEDATAASQELLERLGADVVRADLTAKPPRGLGAVRRKLTLVYSRHALARMRGVSDLPLTVVADFLSPVAAQAITAKFVAGALSQRVLVLDAGASSVTGVCAEGADARYTTLSGTGLGRGAPALYGKTGEESIRRWLPFEPQTDEIAVWALNRGLHPLSVPLTLRQALIEGAFMREALRVVIEALDVDAPPDLVIGSGALVRGMKPQAAAVALLDALGAAVPSWQRVTLALDTGNVLLAAGALAAEHPKMAAEVWRFDGPRTVATALAVRGAKRNSVAVACRPGWVAQPANLSIQGGELRVLRPPFGVSADVELTPVKGVRLPGSVKLQPVTVSLQPSAGYPLPQLMVDARPAGPPTGSRRTASVLKCLGDTGVYTARELESV